VRRRTDLIAVALLLLAVLAVWADVLGGTRALYTRDVARVYVPERAVLGGILRGGEIPHWNPHFAAGQPFAANPQYEAFYPPQWLAALPSAVYGFHLEVVLHILLAGLGMFFFLRDLDLRTAAAAFGALSFALGGLMLSLTNVVPFLFSIAWWPLIALCVRRKNLALAALALGMMFLVAERTMILQAAALVLGYAAYRMRGKGVRLAAMTGGGALMVSAAQIVPALDFQPDSGRYAALPLEVARLWSMELLRPLEMILPSAFGHLTPDAIYFWSSSHPTGTEWLFSLYAGTLAAALVIAGFIHRIRGWAFTVVACIVSYAFAVQPLIYYLGFRTIRHPEKFAITGAFVLIVFAAIAADRFLNDAAFRRTTFFVSIGISALAAGSLAFAWSPLFARAWHLRGYYDDILREARDGALSTLATAVGLTLILVFRERPRLAVPLLGAFVLADLAPRTYGVAPRIDADFYDPPAIARTIPPGSRLYNDAAWQLELTPQPPIAYDDRWTRMHNAMLPEMQALWGFDSMFEGDVTRTMLQPTGELAQIFWRAKFARQYDRVGSILAAAGVTHVITLRDAGTPTDPVSVVPLHGERWHLEGSVVRALQTANDIDLDVDAAKPTRLFVSVTRHKYWRATVDGAPTPIHPANVAFQAIDVPAGRHHVAMRYRNPVVVVCGIVSLLSALALAAAALRSRAQRPPLPH
jgi:hypothetical protein